MKKKFQDMELLEEKKGPRYQQKNLRNVNYAKDMVKKPRKEKIDELLVDGKNH